MKRTAHVADVVVVILAAAFGLACAPTTGSGWTDWPSRADFFNFLNPVVTAVGFYFAYKQLKVAAEQSRKEAEDVRKEYAWRRTQQAVEMIASWNQNTASHRLAIDLQYPGLLDEAGPLRRTVLDDDLAATIHDADARDRKPEDEAYRCVVMRGHFVEMLNFCEYVASTSRRGAADAELVRDMFGSVLHRWYHALEPYVRHVAKDRNGANPWTELEAFVLAYCPRSQGGACKVGSAYEQHRPAQGRVETGA